MNDQVIAQRRIEFDSSINYYRVFFPYDAAIIRQLKPLSRYRDDARGKHWVIPYCPLGNVLVRSLRQQNHFVITKDTQEALDKYAEYSFLNEIQSRALTTDTEFPIEGRFPMLGALREYQQAGVEYAVRNKRLILGDTMGLGKSVQFIITANVLGSWPVMVVCGAKLKHNLRKEFEKFLDGVRVYVCEGYSDPVPDGYDVYIVNFDILAQRVTARQYQNKFEDNYPIFWQWKKKGDVTHVLVPTDTGLSLWEKQFNIVGVDEAQKIKNRFSQRSLAVKAFADGADYIIGLTGGAIENKPSEFVGILMLLDRLEEMGGWAHFITHYCGGYQETIYIKGGKGQRRTVWVRDGWDKYLKDAVDKARGVELDPQNALEEAIKFRNRRLLELNHEMRRRGVYVRRTLKDVAPELGDPVPNYIYTELDNQAEYHAEEDAFFDWLMQYKSVSAAYDEDPAQALGLYGRLWRLNSMGKLSTIVDMLEESFVNQEKVITWLYHKDAQKAVLEAIPDSLALFWTRDIEATKEQFQSTPDQWHVLLASLMADHLGHTLTAAWHHIFGSLYWNPSVIQQAISRSYGRENDMHTVYVHYVLGEDSIDIDMKEMIENKSRVVGIAVDGVLPGPGAVAYEVGQREAYVDLMTRLKSRRQG